MADEKRGPSGPAGVPGGKRRRPQPPTIDLRATEIPPVAASTAANPSSDSPPPAGDAVERAPTQALPETAAAQQAAGTDPRKESDAPRAPEATSSTTAAERPAQASGGERAGSPSPEPGGETPWTSPSAVTAQPPAPQSALLLAAAVGACAAAFVVIGVIIGLWQVGGITSQDERVPPLALRVSGLDASTREAARHATATEEAISALGARAAEGEQARAQVKDLEGRLANAEGAVARMRELTERLANADVFLIASRVVAGEQALALLREMEGRLDNAEAALHASRRPASDPAQADRVAAVDTETKSLAEGLAALRKRVEEIAASAQAARDAAARSSNAAAASSAEMVGNIEGLAKRIAALEDSLKTLQATASRPAAPDVDRAARFAAAALALRGLVERGEPFAAELAAVKALISDQAALAPLEPFAVAGVPHASALARELSSLAVALRRSPEGEGRAGGMLDRLQTGAGKLVRIRPLDTPPAADSGDAIARLETQAARGDIAGALTELAKLPAAERVPLEPWIRKAEGRIAAVEQARRLAGAALDGLGKTR